MLVGAQSLVNEAREVGLWDGAEVPITFNELREILQGLQGWTSEDEAAPNPGRLRELQEELGRLRQQLEERTLQIQAAEVYAQEAEGYGSAQAQQQLRLESIGLFSQKEHDAETCPLCSQTLEIPTPHVEQLRSALQRVRDNTERVQRSTPQMREYIEELKQEREDLRRESSRAQEAIEGVYRENEQARRLRRHQFKMQSCRWSHHILAGKRARDGRFP